MPTDQKEALIIVDQPTALGRDLRAELEELGWQTLVTNSVRPARKLLSENQFDLLILDETTLPEMQLADILSERPEKIPVFVIATQDGTQLQTAPALDPDALLSYPLIPAELQDALTQKRTRPDTTILGRSDAMQQIRESVAQIAPTPVSVLITGESGSGKNLIAEAIHRQSARSDEPFLIINCGAIPETLLESELFGHERGAFTDARTQRSGIFEAANRGTVFLDEIGEMSLSAQVRLLRVLDAKEVTRLGSTAPITVDVRVIAATNRNLQQAVAEGKFRQDLYQRLRVIEIEMPPLRAHPQDIPFIAQNIIQKQSGELRMPPIEFAPDAMNALQQYHWPGNVRELINLIERLMVLAKTRHISALDLAQYLDTSPVTEPSYLPVLAGKTPAESDRDLLYWAILEVAKDIKELKAYLMQSMQTSPPPSLPVPIYDTPIEETEIGYTETETPAETQALTEKDIRPLRDLEREAIANALNITGGHRERTAKLLGMAVRTLYRKIDQYDL
ncbi:MAG: sigma-54-dependent Fis family transcriptional regulator [Candidatus Latescibacteria bacterium]|nr:sigma-54-dependent Fis family transcriptional regulator [Candidatus Latescibacterota bacterium]